MDKPIIEIKFNDGGGIDFWIALPLAILGVMIILKLIAGIWFPWQETDIEKAVKNPKLNALDFNSPDEMVSAHKKNTKKI